MFDNILVSVLATITTNLRKIKEIVVALYWREVGLRIWRGVRMLTENELRSLVSSRYQFIDCISECKNESLPKSFADLLNFRLNPLSLWCTLVRLGKVRVKELLRHVSTTNLNSMPENAFLGFSKFFKRKKRISLPFFFFKQKYFYFLSEVQGRLLRLKIWQDVRESKFWTNLERARCLISPCYPSPFEKDIVSCISKWYSKWPYLDERSPFR